MDERPAHAQGLPSGGWFVPRDLDTKPFTRGERDDVLELLYDVPIDARKAVFDSRVDKDDPESVRAAEEAVNQAMDRESMHRIQGFDRALTALAIDSWSFGAVAADALRDLTLADSKVIEDAAKKVTPALLSGLDFETPTGPGEESPTEPGSD